MKNILSFLFLITTLFSFSQVMYQHNFGTTAISGTPYTVAPTSINTNLSTSSWSTNASGGFVNYAGSAGQSLGVSNSSGSTSYTLTFNVASGYQTSITSFNFWRQRSATGAQNWNMTINGTNVGTGTVPTTGAALGTTTVSNAVNNLTGTITIIINLSGATGAGTFRLDDFRLNGTVSPINDICSSSLSLPCGTSNLTGSTVGTVSETAPSTCVGSYGVWYTFSGDGQSTTISSYSTTDIGIYIGYGNCSTKTQVACVDSYIGGNTESYTFTSVVGQTYYVYIAYYGTGTTTGTFTISRSCTTPPSNDDCSTATNLPCSTTNLAGTTVGSSSETAPGGGGLASPYGVWYSFTGNGSQTTISATGSSFDIEMTIVQGNCASNTLVSSQDLSGSTGTETYTFTPTNGVVYYVYIAYWSSTGTATDVGTFTISRTTVNSTSTLSSSAGTNSQTVCKGSPITNITYTTTSANGATFSGLPTGVSGSWSSNIITISGTPIVSGTFNYTVTLTGGCGTVTSSGTIIVNPLVSSISSITGSSNIIAGTTETYSIPSDPNATSYQWDYKESSSGSWITNISSTTSASINWSTTTTSGAEVLVTVTNSCGSQSKNLTIYVDGVLPIELISFTGKVINTRNVLLEWSTASEQNNDYFIIERSTDGYNWMVIKNIDASGNSTVKINYTTIDNSAPKTIVYYRLSQVDFDGVCETFSPINVNLTLVDKNCDYEYYDLNGKLIDINVVSPGAYLRTCGNETIKIWKY